MSLIFKCDVCGKDSAMTGIDFSNGPMFIRKRNHEGKVVRIFLNMMIEDEDDFKRLIEAKKQIMKMKNMFSQEEAIMEGEGEDEIEDFLDSEESFAIELENPYPMICNQCKKLLAKDILEKSEFPDEKKTYSTSSKRLGDLKKLLSND